MKDLRYGIYGGSTIGYKFIKQLEEPTSFVDNKFRPGCIGYIAYFEDVRGEHYWVASSTPDMECPYAIEREHSGIVEKCNRHVHTDYDLINTRKHLGL